MDTQNQLRMENTVLHMAPAIPQIGRRGNRTPRSLQTQRAIPNPTPPQPTTPTHNILGRTQRNPQNSSKLDRPNQPKKRKQHMKITIIISITCKRCHTELTTKDRITEAAAATRFFEIMQERIRYTAIQKGWRLYTRTRTYQETAYCPNCKDLTWHVM